MPTLANVGLPHSLDVYLSSFLWPASIFVVLGVEWLVLRRVLPEYRRNLAARTLFANLISWVIGLILITTGTLFWLLDIDDFQQSLIGFAVALGLSVAVELLVHRLFVPTEIVKTPRLARATAVANVASYALLLLFVLLRAELPLREFR